MIDEKGKSKIVEEVKSGMISCLGASRKYGVSRNSIKAWAGKINLTSFLSTGKFLQPLDVTQNQESKLPVKKIQELTKALELSRLKNLALETIIEVAESDFHIKIRKKHGTKQS